MSEKVVIKNLDYRIEQTEILKNINIQFQEGKFTGIVGPNGSGKSTLLKNIYGTLSPERGQILLDGEDLHKMDPKTAAKKIAVLPQENKTDFSYTVEECVLMGRFSYRGMFGFKSNEEDEELVDKYLSLLGLDKLRQRLFASLSGGEKQRVLLARALTQETNTLILDEVTNHLDIGYQYKIMEFLKVIPKTIIAAIHDLNLALKFCDYVFLIQDGIIINEGLPIEVLNPDTLVEVFGVHGNLIDRGSHQFIEYTHSAAGSSHEKVF